MSFELPAGFATAAAVAVGGRVGAVVGTGVDVAALVAVAVGGRVSAIAGTGVAVGAGEHPLNNNVRARIEVQV